MNIAINIFFWNQLYRETAFIWAFIDIESTKMFIDQWHVWFSVPFLKVFNSQRFNLKVFLEEPLIILVFSLQICFGSSVTRRTSRPLRFLIIFIEFLSLFFKFIFFFARKVCSCNWSLVQIQGRFYLRSLAKFLSTRSRSHFFLVLTYSIWHGIRYWNFSWISWWNIEDLLTHLFVKGLSL